MTRMLAAGAALCAAAAALGVPEEAQAQQPPGAASATQGRSMSAFYVACLQSEGIPGIFAEGERATTVLYAGAGSAPRLVSIALAPDAAEAVRVALTAHGGTSTLPYVTLTPGQSATFAATSLTAQPNARRAEYCLRVR